MLTLGLGDLEPPLESHAGTGEAKDKNENDELPEAPYFITFSRNGSFRRLRAVRQERCLTTMPIFKLTHDVADAICKRCAPKIEGKMGDENSSESQGSSDLLEVEENAEQEVDI